MRARLSAISNFTTLQLLTILQNWITHTSEIIIIGQVLTVTSVSFLSNDTTQVLASGSPNQTSNDETNTKNNMILFSVIGSAGGLLLFLFVCCIIMLACIFKKFKSKRNNNLKPRFVVFVLSNNNDVITIIICRIHQEQEREDNNKDIYYLTTERQLDNELYLIHDHDNDGISSNRYLEILTFYVLQYIDFLVL